MASRFFFSALISLAAICSVAPSGQAQFGGMPEKSFDEYTRPTVPDYTDPSSWAALPDTQDAADLAPPGTSVPEAQAMALVDVFYLHPTTYGHEKL